ncbi:PPE-repeat protein [Amycolatopsis tolypomycina]|uniref:PPE-repeat protein n=1 Tax=Amycolatopsis tolypomycina TaxID=208445 RepID=A0A1H4I6C8_9PSEU|nr:PPE domain-containing protein [Amycolatopsis tolypomycina]SEB29513.1 PPE-repeat protein [Amycolatopsis tolypomycina]
MVTEGPLTAAQIYEQITGGKGTQSLIDTQESTNHLTQRMIERAERISALRAKTMSGWQGDAGSAAADSTAPLIQAAMDDAIHLKNAQTAVEAQIGAFGTAKNSVKPVAAQPPDITASDLYDTFAGDGKLYQTKVAGWQADSQANIDAFRVYHSASTTNGTQMPAQYAQLSGSGAPITMDTGTPPATGRTTDTGNNTQNQRQTRQPGIPERSQYRPGTQAGQDRTGQNQTGQNQTGQSQTGQNQIGGRPPEIPSDGTHANSYVPKPVMPAANTGYQFGPTGQPINSLGPGGSGPYSGGEFGPGTGYGPGSGTSYGPGSGTGSYRGTGSGAVNEPGARGMGPGSGSGRGLPGASVAGGRPGAPGVAGGRGAGGMPMGAVGAGQGKKEEDTEKKAAAYLRNPDPDDTFGGDIEKPMPPVIGEKRAQR